MPLGGDVRRGLGLDPAGRRFLIMDDPMQWFDMFPGLRSWVGREVDPAGPLGARWRCPAAVAGGGAWIAWIAWLAVAPTNGQGISSEVHELHWQKGFLEAAQVVGLEDAAVVFRTGPEATGRTRSAPAERPVPWDQLVGWGGWSGLRRQSAVWLIDGSWLCGDLTITAGGDVSVASDWFDCPAIPTTLVRGIVWEPPYSVENWLTRWQEVSGVTGNTDVVWTTKGEALRGILRWPQQEGVLRSVALESEGRNVELLLTDVEAVVYAPKLLGPLPRKRHGVSLAIADGSYLNCAEVRRAEGKVRLMLDCGLRLTSWVDAAHLARQIRGLFGFPPPVVFLSDLAPADYKFLSNRGTRWELGRDVDVYGRPLLASDRGIVPTGLALHASSRVAYRHDGRPGRLRSEVLLALPQSPEQRLGSVGVQVLVAREGRLQQAEALQLRRSEPAVHRVDVELEGVQLIVIVVDQWDYEQLGDHVLWLHARIDPP